MLRNRPAPAQEVPLPSGMAAVEMPSLATVSKTSSGQSPTPPSSRVWILVPAIFALAALTSFGALYLRIAPSARSNARRVIAAKVQPADLGIRLTTQGDRVLVNWNRSIPALGSASYGVLSIHDGAEHHSVDLPPGELTNGSLLYKPASQDVTFRLEIHGSRGTLVSSLVRTPGGSAPSPLPAASVKAQSVGRPMSTSSVKASKSRPASEPVSKPTASPVASKSEASAPSANVAPKPIKTVMPNVRALGPLPLREPMDIQVELKIDENGRVISASASGNEAGGVEPLLATESIAAAKQWIFEPAKVRGKSVPSDHVIVFRFRPSGP